MIYFSDFGGASSPGITYVGGKTMGVPDTAGFQTLSITGLTGGSDTAPAAGDIVIVAYATGYPTSNTDVQVTGYTEIADLYANDTIDTNFGAFYKIMGSTPDTTISVSPTGGSGEGGVVAIHVWRGVNSTTPLDVATTTATGLNSCLPNPPAITPVTSGAVIIAMGGSFLGGAVYQSSDLSNFRSDIFGSLRVANVGIGSKVWTGGTFDPAAWTFAGTDDTNYGWCACTIALRPA